MGKAIPSCYIVHVCKKEKMIYKIANVMCPCKPFNHENAVVNE
jgi:hypothetical protein